MKLRLMICAAVASTALFATEDAKSATYAVMNVTNAYTDTVIAVPWVGFDGSAITISNLVNTTTLTAGDKLFMYGSDGKWYAYGRGDSGAWTNALTVSSDGVTVTAADEQTVQRGTGLILQRASDGGNVFLCGRVGTGDVTTSIAVGKTLFANPTASDVALNTDALTTGATNGDTISIPLNNGGADVYTFNGTEWGKTTSVAYQRRVGTSEPPQYRTSYSNAWEKCGLIPAGTGAWYERKASEGRTINW